jgi:hypothetical protein
MKTMNVAFCIPTTSNMRNWTNIGESYLKESLKPLNDNYPGLTVYLSYDDTDVLYRTQITMLSEMFENLDIHYIKQTGFEPGNVVKHWNTLSQIAFKNGFEYIYLIGDDIHYPDTKEWLPKMIGKLKDNGNIGFSAGDSGNPHLPMTQFLIHKTHYDIFGYAFNPMLKNWFCDNWFCDLYPKKYINYLPDIKLLNAGGTPRYTPNDANRLHKILVKRDKHTLKKFLS